jgi:7-cyano-7-deazaguanine reductase
VTGQPDFAHIIIDYVPGAHILESKSLKLYLFGYRNHGAFHEDCTQKIANDIVAAVNPYWLRIAAFWFPRGGIPIDVFLQTGTPPDGVYVPSLEGLGYRGRG